MSSRLRGIRALAGIVVGLGIAVTGLSAPAVQANALTSTRQLLTAKVPSMCDNPAGTLVDGELPNVAGWVSLDLDNTVLAPLVKRGGTGAVATVHCNAGGIGWPDHLVFYGANGAIIGHYDAVVLGVGGSSRASVASISVKARVVTVRFREVPRSDDNELWGSSAAQVRFSYNAKKHRMSVLSTHYFTENATGKQLLALVRAGKIAAARRLAAPEVVSELAKLVKEDRASRNVWVKFSGCGGPYMWGSDNEWFVDQFDSGERGCLYTIHRKEGSEDYASTYLVVFQHPEGDTYWAKWYGYKFVGVAG
jgi:hypothetical protein